jgi:hypothetical protein
MVGHGAKAARDRGSYDDEARGSKMAHATRFGARGTAGNASLRGFNPTCQEISPENPRSATLNAFPRVSHLSGNSWPAQPCR